MSDFDEELEEDLEDTASEDEEADDFEDPQQTTAALTMEINKLRQKNEVLRQFNVKQKDRYKDEVRSFLSPLIQKYKDIQGENDFLKRQIKEIGQSKEYLSKAKTIGENGNHEKEDFVALMESTIQEKEHEIAVLNKMVKSLEEESYSLKRNVAELPELKVTLRQKTEALARLDEEKFDLLSKVEAKESLTEKYLKQINDLETNIYVLNKRISERNGQFETGKVSEYEDKLEKANEKIERLNHKIHNMEKQLSDYQQTMSSLEEELEEEEFLKGTSSNKSTSENEEDEKPAKTFDYNKYPEVEDEYISSDELPSDDDLLAEDIELEELATEDELVDSTESLENDDIELEELSVEDNFSIEAENDNDDLSLEELPLDDEELLLGDEELLGLEDDDEGFDVPSVEDLIEKKELKLEKAHSDINLNKQDSTDDKPIERKFDLRTTNMENIQLLSDLTTESSPFKEDASEELFDDELPLEDLEDDNKPVKS